MIVLIVLASIAGIFVLFLAVQVWQRFSQPAELGQEFRLTPVDVDAFENLIDPEEEEYLKVHLPPREFRRVQRSRIRVAKKYVAVLSRNAGVLMAVGQSARNDPNPENEASGEELVQRAVRLKLWCLLSEVRLTGAFVFPTRWSPSNAIASRYLAAKHLAANLSGKPVA